MLHWLITDPHWAANVFAAEYTHFGLEKHGTWGPFRDNKVWTWVICCCCCCILWCKYGAKYRCIKTRKETRCFQGWITYWPFVSHKNEQIPENVSQKICYYDVFVFLLHVSNLSPGLSSFIRHKMAVHVTPLSLICLPSAVCLLICGPFPLAINYQKKNTGWDRVGLQWKELAVKYRLLCADNSIICIWG